MKRHRTFAAAPVRSAADAWRVVSGLLSQTLERSPAIPDGSVATELDILHGLGPALIAGGHLESNGLVLVDIGLHLTILVVTGDAAIRVDENLNPVPGGANCHKRLDAPFACRRVPQFHYRRCIGAFVPFVGGRATVNGSLSQRPRP